MAAAAILKNRKLAISLTNLREIWYGDAYWASEWDRKLKFAERTAVLGLKQSI